MKAMQLLLLDVTIPIERKKTLASILLALRILPMAKDLENSLEKSDDWLLEP